MKVKVLEIIWVGCGMKLTPTGKFRPWILRMAIPIVIFRILTFSAFLALLASPLHINVCLFYLY